MKTIENYTVAKGFESLFDFSEKGQNELDTLWIAAQFLSIIKDEMIRQQITRKELALRIGTSASWLTQVFRGDKLPNLETITKLKNVLNIEFDIRQKDEVISVSYDDEETQDKFPRPILPLRPHWYNNMLLENIDYNEINKELERPIRGEKNNKYSEVA
jgi:transcriptional regulator with XRE-family HTH domain